MKVSPASVAYILNVVKTARLVGIDNIIIEKDLVRAMDDANSVVLFQGKDVPDMEFGSIGLTRINDLMARYEIAQSQDNFTVEANVSDDVDFAKSLLFKGKGVKVDYRCANPEAIKAPRQINDEMKYSVQLNSEAVTLLQKGQAAMNTDDVSIISNDGVSFELSDVNNDVFKHTFAQEATALVGNSTKFAYHYPAKILLAIFKTNTDGIFKVGAKGILSFAMNGLTIYVLPKV